MTNFEIARRYTGLSAVELARLLDVSPQQLNGWIQGTRVPSRTTVDRIAASMGVDAAWLLGVPQRLGVWDHIQQTVLPCPIMHSEFTPVGVFYIVWVDAIDEWLPVIHGNGVQFTPADWLNPYKPRTASDAAECAWVDHRGVDAIMVDGLPRAII